MNAKKSLSLLEYLHSEIQRQEESYRQALRERKIFADLKIIKNRIKKIKQVIRNLENQQAPHSMTELSKEQSSRLYFPR
jgi:hypothetical protein